MPWQQLTIRLSADALPRAESLLALAGAHSVAVTDAGDDPVLEPAPGEIPAWRGVVVKALFDDRTDLEQILAMLVDGGRDRVDAAAIDAIADENWIDAWRQTITPIRVGRRLAIVPAEDMSKEPELGQVAVHMGLAFGTGSHATTRLCLDWLEAEIAGGETVLDYGCGSGILALAALRLGARHAWATDNDPQALAASAENAKLNGLEDGLWLGSPEQLSCDGVDVILANVVARPLIELATSFASLQAPGGRIVLSGVLPAQAPAVEAAYRMDYDKIERIERDGWVRIVGSRRSDRSPPNRNAGAGVHDRNG